MEDFPNPGSSDPREGDEYSRAEESMATEVQPAEGSTPGSGARSGGEAEGGGARGGGVRGGRAAGGLTRTWQRLAMALGLLVAIMLGISGELAYSALTSASPTPRPSAVAAITPTPSLSPTPQVSGSSAVSPSASPSPPPPASSPYATVTFRDLMLEVLPSGQARKFEFTSDGPGLVSAEIVAAAPLNSTKICLAMGDGSPTCSTGVTPGVSATVGPTGESQNWTVIVIGTKKGTTPVVDIAFVWPTQTPSLTMSQARFQGLPNPDSLRGFTAWFTTRSAGTMQFDAHWSPVTANASIILVDETKSAVVDRSSVTKATGTNPPYQHAVEGGHVYQLQLLDTSADTGHPNLIVTISFS